jgi:hypothetical protein
MAKITYKKLLIYFKENSQGDLELLERIKKVAEFRGDSFSDFIKDAVRYYLREIR